MKSGRNSRRTFIAGMIAVIGAGLCTRTAWAFPDGTQELMRKVSRLLRPFGISVAALFDTELERDVLRFSRKYKDITYDWSVIGHGSSGPLFTMSSFGDAVEFTNFDISTGQPDLKMTSQGRQSMIEILDPQAHIQVIIPGGATYELQDGLLIRVD